MLPQNAQPDDVCGHACQSKSSLMIVDDIFSCRQMKRMRKWLSKAMPKYQHQPQTMKSLAQTAANVSSLQVLIFLNLLARPHAEEILLSIHHSTSLFTSVDSNLLTS